jgi:hypothetical protein
MTRKKGKAVSFDAMVKFFMQSYGIPTKRDIDNILTRLDRIERMLGAFQTAGKGRRTAVGTTSMGDAIAMNASDLVLEVISRYRQGASFKDIQASTGFGEKKLRNVIYRLNSIGKIQRVSRGQYVVAEN